MTRTLDHLRAQAKTLKKAHATGDPDALERVQKTLGDKAPLRHADFLHVIAVEAGHQSWPRLKLASEAAQMTRDARAERLKMALYFGQNWVVDGLLAQDPTLPRHNLGLQIAMYDLEALRTAIAADPTAAIRPIGVRSPLLHLAFSQYHHMAPEKTADMLAIARHLLDHGADPNDGYPAEPGSDHNLSALYGALGHANNLPLAELLLERGANPNDNESLYHATELGHADALRLLLRYKADPCGTNALARAMDFDSLEMVTLLLDAGADPNEDIGPHPSGEPVPSVPALHQAARRWCSAPVLRAVLARGGDPTAQWHGMTPYAVARIFGNTAASEVLAAAGHATPLTAVQAQLAACADGTPPAARIAPQTLPPELARLATRIAARPERLAHLRALLLAGLDPETPEEMGLTPLHVAGWEGLPEHVAFLLTLAPDLTRRNAFGGDALGTVLHGAEFSPHRASRDHLTCARLLLEAGAPVDPRDVAGTGREDLAALLKDWAENESVTT